MSQKVGRYLESTGIHHELGVPPEQYNFAELMNRTLLESARLMMVHIGLPDKVWAEVVKCAAYIMNRTPTFARHPLKSGEERNQTFHT